MGQNATPDQEPCDLFLDEHKDGRCTDRRHQECLDIVARRDKGRPWGRIVEGRDGGGKRDFLDGKPIHCGTVLELQAVGDASDDVGEYKRYLSTGTLVGYEKEFHKADEEWNGVTLYATVSGYTVCLRHTSGMRFRWPR